MRSLIESITLVFIAAVVSNFLAADPGMATPVRHSHKRPDSYKCFIYKDGKVGCEEVNNLHKIDYSFVDEEVSAKTVEALLVAFEKMMSSDGVSTRIVDVDGRITQGEALNFVAVVSFFADSDAIGSCGKEKQKKDQSI